MCWACESGDRERIWALVDVISTGQMPAGHTAEDLRAMGLPYGLSVVRAGSLAERSGLRIGDVVYGVNQTRIRNLQEFSGALAQLQDGRLSLLVRRGKTDLQVPLEIGGLPAEDGVLRVPRPSTDTLLRT